MDSDFKERLNEFMKVVPKNKPIKNHKDIKHMPKNIKDWLKNG